MKKSKKIFNAAKKYIPGGVNSPVRAFSAVNDIPFFVKKSQGAYLTDIDDKKYIDYILESKALIPSNPFSTLGRNLIQKTVDDPRT